MVIELAKRIYHFPEQKESYRLDQKEIYHGVAYLFFLRKQPSFYFHPHLSIAVLIGPCFYRMELYPTGLSLQYYKNKDPHSWHISDVYYQDEKLDHHYKKNLLFSKICAKILFPDYSVHQYAIKYTAQYPYHDSRENTFGIKHTYYHCS